jgi:hypothetical protein
VVDSRKPDEIYSDRPAIGHRRTDRIETTGTLVGRRNLYTCALCGRQWVTVDRDDGTTPFMVHCRMFGGTFGDAGPCPGICHSSFYPVGADTLEPTHEWYAPAADERSVIMQKKQYALAQHVALGGLLLRAIPPDHAAAQR